MSIIDTLLGDGQGGLDKKKILMMGLAVMMYMKNKDGAGDTGGALGGLLGALGGGGSGGGLGGLLGSLAGGGNAGGGLGGLLGALGGGSNSSLGGIAKLAGLAGALGGIGGLQSRMQQAGMADQAASWIGTGANLGIDASQIMQVLGNGNISQLAEAAGVSPDEAAEFAAQHLPNLVDKLTPNGQAQEGQVDLMSIATQLLR